MRGPASEPRGSKPGEGRTTPLDLSAEEFRKIGYELVDAIAAHLSSLPERPVTRGESPAAIKALLDAERGLPAQGSSAEDLVRDTARLLFDHSLFNGHPRFWGYITSPPAPVGILGDMLASAVNANVGAWGLAPVATEIEAQTVRWLGELAGYPNADPGNCSGLLVSGGNMANLVCFLTARAAKADWDVRKTGLRGTGSRPMLVYGSEGTHTWIHKAADLFGMGTESIRWIKMDARQRIDVAALRAQVAADRESGGLPFLVVGTAGSVSTGAVDPLFELAAFCREQDLWFHVDGAYGGLAARVPGVPEDLKGLGEADSVAVDPHKWLYAPLEAGCVLVKDAAQLRHAFSYHPSYYHFDEEAINYFDMGPQNSRGFRALKVWLQLCQAGRDGYVQMIASDIESSQILFDLMGKVADVEVCSQALSITTFRYLPDDLKERADEAVVAEYLNRINREILSRIERSGEAFLSNAVLDGKFTLRMCIVNFHTSKADVEALPELVVRMGRAVDAELRTSL